MKTINENFFWDQCEIELACNSISFYNGDSEKLYYRDNCLLYTNNSPETKKTKTFVSKIRKPKSSVNICWFHQNFINISWINLDQLIRSYYEFPNSLLNGFKNNENTTTVTINECWDLCETNSFIKCAAISFNNYHSTCYLYDTEFFEKMVNVYHQGSVNANRALSVKNVKSVSIDLF